MAAFPGARLDRVLSLFGRPQAKPVMMFRDEDNIFDSGRFGGSHPLLWIGGRWIEGRWVRCSVSPLAVHEGVWAEVNDRADFEILPSHLLRTGLHVGEVLRPRKRCT